MGHGKTGNSAVSEILLPRLRQKSRTRGRASAARHPDPLLTSRPSYLGRPLEEVHRILRAAGALSLSIPYLGACARTPDGEVRPAEGELRTFDGEMGDWRAHTLPTRGGEAC